LNKSELWSEALTANLCFGAGLFLVCAHAADQKIKNRSFFSAGAVDPKMAASTERQGLPRHRGDAGYDCRHGEAGAGGLPPVFAWRVIKEKLLG
jgi:hypothetical protein